MGSTWELNKTQAHEEMLLLQCCCSFSVQSIIVSKAWHVFVQLDITGHYFGFLHLQDQEDLLFVGFIKQDKDKLSILVAQLAS